VTPVIVKQPRLTGGGGGGIHLPSTTTTSLKFEGSGNIASVNKQTPADKQTKFTIGPEITLTSSFATTSNRRPASAGTGTTTSNAGGAASSRKGARNGEVGKESEVWNEFADFGGDPLTASSDLCTPKREVLEGGVSGLSVTPSLHKSSSK